MRLKINLATQPYEDARHFVAVWSGIFAALLILAFVLSYAVITRWHHYRTMSHQIAREQQILSDFQNKRQQDIAILNRPENQDVREKSQYLNNLIRQKEISWTKVFTDLEKMMPAHLRVLAVQPKLENDQIILNMQLGGDSRDRAAELVRRMEQSKTFRYPQIVTENDIVGTPGQADAMRFTLTTEYVPAVESEARTPTTTARTEPPAGGGQ